MNVLLATRIFLIARGCFHKANREHQLDFIGRMSRETLAECRAKPWPNVMRNRGRMPCETVAGCRADMQLGWIRKEHA